MVHEQPITVNLTQLDPSQKRSYIISIFDQLQPGGSFIIENDLDPIPHFHSLLIDRKNDLDGYKYLQKGPISWKILITKSSTPFDADGNSAEEVKRTEQNLLDVTKLSPTLKHPTIFEWYNKLEQGESFKIRNDHDPKPLFYQLLGELGPVFTWQYQLKGPEEWIIVLGKKGKEESTIGEIAAKDSRKAEAMKKMGIDFCCGEHKSVHNAIADAGIPHVYFDQVISESAVGEVEEKNSYDRWDTDFLADYIYHQHHKYFYDCKDEILYLSGKVTEAHGKIHPELNSLNQVITSLFSDLSTHFIKEEKVLFPYIRDLAVAKRMGVVPQGSILLGEGPLTLMHIEHEEAGNTLKSMRVLTNNYRLPEDACNSFSRLYDMLQDFESDIHQHVHLENNILFPKALSLERELLQSVDLVS